MAIFERLKETLLGYLTPTDTPKNQRALHRARPAQSPTPLINANGKRFRPHSAGRGSSKRLKTPNGPAAYLTPPSIQIVGPDSDDSSFDFFDDDSWYEQDSEEIKSSEWEFINSDLRAEKDSPIHEYSATKKLLSHFASPEYKKRLAQDKTNVQPDKDFDESDLKAFEIEKVIAKRQEDAREMREIGWADDPIKIYLKLTMRGWEPLFPKTWKLSFDSFPRVLFADKPEDEYIKALSDNEFRAMRAFRSLVMIGSKARDATLHEVSTPPMRQPQELIRREMKNYLKWAFADANVADITPTLAILSGPEDVDPQVLERKMIKRLTKLKQQWLSNLTIVQGTDENGNDVQIGELCDPPTIYGIIVSNLMICLVALEDEDDGYEQPRIHAFSWNNMAKPEYDVWTTITIAILVMHCRMKMLNLKQVMDDFVKQWEESSSES
ncbi:hypothetical protein SLS57_006825 [Botryosphaeria dothidea]